MDKQISIDKQAITILLVDDTPANLELLIAYLKTEGYKISVAQSGEAAIKRSKYLLPDIILLDVIMAGIDGFETCVELKKHNETKDIPVIFMSALTDTVDKVKGFDAGGVDYITKPFENKEVLVRVENHLKIRLMQKELLLAKEQAEAANIAKSNFLTNISHEIRTPINAIVGFTEILNQKITDTSHKFHLKNILSSSKSLLSLINDLLDISKIDAGKLELSNRTVNIRDLIQVIETPLIQKANDKSLEFKVVIESNVPDYIEIDVVRFKQMLINLIDNAIKFTTKGFVNFTLKASMITESSFTLIIIVADSGKGIPSDKIDEMFEAFKQENAGIDRDNEGTGLGLSLIKGIVNMLSGSISVNSELNKGTEFTIELPKIKISDKSKENTEYKIPKPVAIEKLIDDEMVLTKEQKEKLPLLLNKLKQLKINQWELVKKRQSMKDVKMFAEELSKTNSEFNNQILADYCNNISNDIQFFDVENMKRHIALFEQIIEKLEELNN